MTGEFPAQSASNTKNVSIWWRHHDKKCSIFFRWALLVGRGSRDDSSCSQTSRSDGGHQVSPPVVAAYGVILKQRDHYNDVIMSVMVSQIIGVSIICSSVISGADQRKYQSSASLAFVPAQKASDTENVFIWWRKHAQPLATTAAHGAEGPFIWNFVYSPLPISLREANFLGNFIQSDSEKLIMSKLLGPPTMAPPHQRLRTHTTTTTTTTTKPAKRASDATIMIFL